MSRIKSTDDGLRVVLREAYSRGFSVQSDFARSFADYIAMAASLGLISTQLFGDVFSREWRVTVIGLAQLEALEGNLEDPEEYADDD